MDFYMNNNSRSCAHLVNLLILIGAKNVSKESLEENGTNVLCRIHIYICHTVCEKMNQNRPLCNAKSFPENNGLTLIKFYVVFT